MLPASLETFLQAIELLATQRQPCEVRLIGVGPGVWAWIKKEKPSATPVKPGFIAAIVETDPYAERVEGIEPE